MSDLSLNRRSLATLGSLAANTGDEALQLRAEELMGLANAPVTESPDKLLVAKLTSTWAGVYGDDRSLWPEGLREAIENIGAGIGFSLFGNNLTAALQDLRITNETYPAFEIGVAVVQGFSPSPLAGEVNTGIIPEGAARAGLSFISNPATLIIPIWSAGLFGRAAMGGVSAFGRFLGIASESAAALSIAASVPVEAAAFMGTSSVIARSFARPEFIVSLSNDEGREISSFDRLRMNGARNDTLTEFAASTFFFGGLKLFGWAGTVAQSVLTLTETGVALAKLTGHATSIFGLAATEEIQKRTGNFALGRTTSRLADARSNDMFYESLWRAAFLHGTVQAVNGVVNLNGAGSNNAEITTKAKELLESLRSVTFANAVPAADTGMNPTNILYLGGKDKGDGGKRAEPAITKEEYLARSKRSQMQTKFATTMNALTKAMPKAYIEDIGQTLWFIFRACEGDTRAQQDMVDILPQLADFFGRNVKGGSPANDQAMLTVVLGVRQIYEQIKRIPGIFKFSMAEGRVESRTFFNPVSVFLKEAAHVKDMAPADLAVWLNFVSEVIRQAVPMLHLGGKSTPAINGALRTFVETIGDKRKQYIPVLQLRQILRSKGGASGGSVAELLLKWVFDANAGRYEAGRSAKWKVYSGFSEKTLAYLAKVHELFGVWIDAAPKEAPSSLAIALQHALYAFGIEQNPHKAAHYLDEAGLQDIFDAHRLEGMYQSLPWAKRIGFPEGAFLDRLAFVLVNEPHRVKAVLDITIGFNENAMAYTIRKLFMENCIETGRGAQSLLAMLRDGAIPDESRKPVIDYVLHVMELYKSQLEGEPQHFVLPLEFWQEIISAVLLAGILREAEQAYFREGLRANGFNVGDAKVGEKDIWDHLGVLGFKRGEELPTRGEARTAYGKLVLKLHPDHTKDKEHEAYDKAVEAWKFVEGKLPK